MFMIPSQNRLFFHNQPVNMRKSFDGLSLLVEEHFPGELLTGAYFVFLNKKKDHIKVLFWDKDGFCLWTKRLEKGTFSRKWGEDPALDRTTFLLLLEGVTPKRIQRRFSLKNQEKLIP